ncbi:hypothetical protein [Isobaculum melis]|uniref:Uncharacterized protein n=1 Tax=Isobaculum melis TaxID=142588 RepID=A0A1H9TWG6_9LACT|nr:hypothetical protein [Isobaculum melis]SES01257.1 hypothetical protein SAMN04488559_11713 [Isobaculum melis]
MYSFRKVTLADGSENLVMDFSDSKLQLMSAFLFTEAGPFRQEILEKIEVVKQNNWKHEIFEGNVFYVEMSKRVIYLENQLTEETLQVESNLFFDLFTIWIKETNHFYQKK